MLKKKTNSFIIRFTNIQDKAMLGMKIIPSVYLEEVASLEPRQIVEKFTFFEDDLPMVETFETELLQWKVCIKQKEIYIFPVQ